MKDNAHFCKSANRKDKIDSDFDMEYECRLNFIFVARIDIDTMMCRIRKHAVHYGFACRLNIFIKFVSLDRCCC